MNASRLVVILKVFSGGPHSDPAANQIETAGAHQGRRRPDGLRRTRHHTGEGVDAVLVFATSFVLRRIAAAPTSGRYRRLEVHPQPGPTTAYDSPDLMNKG
ncbi:hypothetical protein ACIBEA_39165 [Streptomyces sp. NPDC051555]|uniref:hypothetical protein n=1 Tax=Streptomyces sp. NPDC051555 TaxID=3365657 RepID=UPI0037AD8E6C